MEVSLRCVGEAGTVFSRPPYQNRVASAVGTNRGVPDISMSGSCNTPVITYSSFTGTGRWRRSCGTSESAPLFAGIVALSDQVAHHWLGLINPALYELSSRHARGIIDVTKSDLLYVDDWQLITADTQRLLGRLAREGKVSGPGDPAPAIGRSVTGTIGQLLAGGCPGRENAEQIALVNPFGMAIEDLAVAHAVYIAAVSRGLGTPLDRL
jgi:hypothetical protein